MAAGGDFVAAVRSSIYFEEVDRLRPFDPAELSPEALRDAVRARARNYIEEAYGSKPAVEAFLMLGCWPPFVQDALQACYRARPHEATAMGGAGPDQAGPGKAVCRAAGVRRRLRLAERRAYDALNLEGDVVGFDRLWRITRERIAFNRARDRIDAQRRSSQGSGASAMEAASPLAASISAAGSNAAPELRNPVLQAHDPAGWVP